MKTLFFLFTLIISTSLFAQDSWTVSHNGITELQASAEDETKNVITIFGKNFFVSEKYKGYLVINCKEANKQKGWKRYIALFNEQDYEFFKQEGNMLKIGNSKLRKLKKPSSKYELYDPIKIYTWSVPTDPKLAARIRIRRVHLATIKFN